MIAITGYFKYMDKDFLSDGSTCLFTGNFKIIYIIRYEAGRKGRRAAESKEIVPFHRRKLYGWRNCRSDNFRFLAVRNTLMVV